jgi:hypothetical protein
MGVYGVAGDLNVMLSRVIARRGDIDYLEGKYNGNQLGLHVQDF